MSSSPGGQGSPQTNARAPYAPRMASLGGLPAELPDIPITAAYLFLFVVFAVVHIKILRKNLNRRHKFLFSGALFGFCKIRIITMSLRIAWACYPRSVNLGIAATIFVYVGTIILFIVNWFFSQRIVRAQHQTWGWSMPYRAVHRAALGGLIACLLMLIVAAVQQFFTQNANVLRIDRAMQLAGQTYFSVIAFAPIVLVGVSLLVPRRGTEKFGAGRLRNNIFILLTAATILSVGQIFRCVTLWLPPVPLRGPNGPQPPPWYFSRACFYVFNFTTEVLVVIFYAVVRVDLRFHVRDSSCGPGDYARGRRESQYRVNIIGDEKKLKRASIHGPDWVQQDNNSNDTLHEYEASIFDDTRTLADSLRYPSSVLEVDSKTGNWKIKRVSSMQSDRWSHVSEPSLWSPDRDTYIEDNVPPMPELPVNWPLRESQMPRHSVPVMEHQNRSSRGHSSHNSTEIPGHDMNRVDMSNAIAEAMSNLEANSKIQPRDGPPDYSAITPTLPGTNMPYEKAYIPSSTSKSSRKSRYYSGPTPTASSSDLPQKQDHSQASPSPKKPHYSPPSSGLPKKHDYSPAPPATMVPRPLNIHRVSSSPLAVEIQHDDHEAEAETEMEMETVHSPGPISSTSTMSTNTEAIREFARFSYEAPRRSNEEPDQSEHAKSDRGKGRQ